MAFELEHDWQGNLATPRARIGESAKTRLLILLCVVWVCLGLISHQPWKPDESQSISIVKQMLAGEHLLTPMAIGQTTIGTPPLYYLSAAGMAKLLSPWLPMHDGARLVSGLWMAITLLMVGMIGRELWGRGIGRQTTFIFLGSLGLIVTAHMLMPEVAALAGCAMGLYALALAKRRPFRASALLGTGIGVAFLAGDVRYAGIVLCTALALPIFFGHWRSKSFFIVLGLSLIAALPWLSIWPLLLWHLAPVQFEGWLAQSVAQFSQHNHWYFTKTLAWFAWPALPMAAWGLWRFRANLLTKPKFQLLIVNFAVALLLTGFAANDREIFALPLLLPLTALAGGSVETLRRGAAGLLNWFGLILFGVMSFLIWLGWFAMMTGWPAKIAERMQVLSAIAEPHFRLPAFLAALLVTVIWCVVVFNAKRSNRAAVTDWAVGITMTWSLLMSLWLPWIDSARSYEKVMHQIATAAPAGFACITSRNLGAAQQALLHYYTDIQTQPFETTQRMDCDLYLIQDERGRDKIEPGPSWQLIWHGKRPTDRRESFRLYQHLG
ncbi:MAG TPA: glycosyl transferase [Methylophilaceae bacterium]|nr:glycosyl transferase [Methylophilaceae bacterium]